MVLTCSVSTIGDLGKEKFQKAGLGISNKMNKVFPVQTFLAKEALIICYFHKFTFQFFGLISIIAESMW